jgi:hypothetical protein
VFRWPVELTPLSLGSHGRPRAATLEVTPRGATFTLAALSHVGHPAHLALIDGYLKGQARTTQTSDIGEDSRTVAASLAAPLLAAHELGVERLTLADLVVMPRDTASSAPADRAANGRPTFTPDSPRLLLRAADAWHWLRAAERFEAPGCLGTRQVGKDDQWHQAIVELPNAAEIARSAGSGRWPVPIVAEVRAPSGQVNRPTPDSVADLRARSRGQARRVTALGIWLDTGAPFLTPTELLSALAGPIRERRPHMALLEWRGLSVDVALSPDLDGYQTLCLLPPTDADPAGLFETMRDLAWESIEALIGRPLPERRSEPIALRLVGADGRSTTLDVGASVVIVRNQTVFTAWVGSDGRVMLKLFPPGGMVGR